MALPRTKLGKCGALCAGKSRLRRWNGWWVGIKDRIFTHFCDSVCICFSMKSVKGFFVVARIENSIGEETVDYP